MGQHKGLVGQHNGHIDSAIQLVVQCRQRLVGFFFWWFSGIAGGYKIWLKTLYIQYKEEEDALRQECRWNDINYTQ